MCTSRFLRDVPFSFLSRKGVPPMYTRVVELTTKPEKARELCAANDDKVLPILKKQAGFVDETVLASDTESIVFWAFTSGIARRVPKANTGSNIPRSTRWPCHLLHLTPL